MSDLLTIENLTKDYGRFRAVDHVSFRVLRSDCLAIIGPNGAGKSTCFNMLGGQIKPDGGRISFNGRDITGLESRQICRLGIGRTFQIPEVFHSMTVAENVQMAMIAAENELSAFGPPAKRLYRSDTIDLLEEVGISSLADRPCGLLAYGELKRIELAIALAHNPRVLLMDEPTAGMSPDERLEFMDTCVELALRGGTALVFTEHDMDVVFQYAGRIVVLHQGKVIADGGPGEVRADHLVRDVYLGADFSHLEEKYHAPNI